MNASTLKLLVATIILCAGIVLVCHVAFANTSKPGNRATTGFVQKVEDKTEGESVEGEGENEEGEFIEGEEEGEGEGEGEEEGEGEGEPVEGEPPVEPGKIDFVDLLSPKTGVTIVQDANVLNMLLVARVKIKDGTLVPSKITVLFSIEDMPYQAAWHEAGFFFLSVELPAEPPVHTESEGEAVEGELVPEEPYYRVKVIAYGEEENDYAESAPYQITIRKAEDLDGNGFADDPFVALPETGDMWFSRIETDTCTRTVAMKSMVWGDGLTSVFVQNPDDPDQVIGVYAPNALVEPEEYGVLAVSTACSPTALYAPYDTSAMAASEPGPLTEGGMYVDAAIIYTRDQGVTFAEVTPLRLAANPIMVTMNRLKTRDGFQNRYYGYPTIIDSDIATGVRAVPLTGVWGEDGINDLGPTSADGIHSVTLNRLYAVAPFEVPFPGKLTIEPDPATGYNFGVVKVNTPITQAFTLTNTGGELLECKIDLQDETGMFFLQGDSLILLEPGASYKLKIQFNPAAAEEYAATVVFTGGEDSPLKLALTGRGAAEVKSIQPLGCGAAPSHESGMMGDLLFGFVVIVGLFWGSKEKQKATFPD